MKEPREPWQMESVDALEINILGMPVAWTVDDDVFVRTGDKTEREDGYVLIGQLEWIDDINDPCDDAKFNEGRLRDFVCEWVKERKNK